MSTKGKFKAANYRGPLILLVCIIIGGVLGMILAATPTAQKLSQKLI